MSEWRQLDPRYVSVQRAKGWIAVAIVIGVWALLLAILLVAREEGLRFLVWTVFLLGLFAAGPLVWLAAAWPSLSYRHYSYRIDEQAIEIRSGVFIRRVTTVPRSRVQHTDVAQGPIERRYGLGTLVVYTAGSHFARVGLPGLEYGTAVSTRDMLLPGGGADGV